MKCALSRSHKTLPPPFHLLNCWVTAKPSCACMSSLLSVIKHLSIPGRQAPKPARKSLWLPPVPASGPAFWLAQLARWAVSVQQPITVLPAATFPASSATLHIWAGLCDSLECALVSPVGNSTLLTGNLGSLSQRCGLP